MAKKKLFGNNIKPACKYCLLCTPDENGEKFSCTKYGDVKPYDACKKFSYNPLMRIPKKEVLLANSDVNKIAF